MWDQFLVYKDSVNNALIRYKVDQVHCQEFTEQITQILSSVGSNLSSNYNLPRLRNYVLLPQQCNFLLFCAIKV